MWGYDKETDEEIGKDGMGFIGGVMQKDEEELALILSDLGPIILF